MQYADYVNQPVTEEQGLIYRARNKGDRAAFAALVERYWERLYRWLYHLSHDCHQAEDLTQEAFMKAFANLASFRLQSNFQAWLFRIAYNNFVNQKRKHARARQPFPDHLPSNDSPPDEQLMSREALQHLARAVGRLPSDFRAAFLLRVEEGLSFAEIADVLEVSEQTARWRVYKARQKLMRVLAPQLDRERL
ncbi:MAG: RNA polymerase sigma factor [Gemmataceae bacterium]